MTNDLISRNVLVEEFRGIARAQANARVFTAADAWEGAAERIKMLPPLTLRRWCMGGGSKSRFYWVRRAYAASAAIITACRMGFLTTAPTAARRWIWRNDDA